MVDRVKMGAKIVLATLIGDLIIKYAPALVTESPQRGMAIPYWGGVFVGIISFSVYMWTLAPQGRLIPRRLPDRDAYPATSSETPEAPERYDEKVIGFGFVISSAVIMAVFTSVFIEGYLGLLVGAVIGVRVGEEIADAYENNMIQLLRYSLAVIFFTTAGTLIAQGVTLEQAIVFLGFLASRIWHIIISTIVFLITGIIVFFLLDIMMPYFVLEY